MADDKNLQLRTSLVLLDATANLKIQQVLNANADKIKYLSDSNFMIGEDPDKPLILIEKDNDGNTLRRYFDESISPTQGHRSVEYASLLTNLSCSEQQFKDVKERLANISNDPKRNSVSYEFELLGISIDSKRIRDLQDYLQIYPEIDLSKVPGEILTFRRIITVNAVGNVVYNYALGSKSAPLKSITINRLDFLCLLEDVLNPDREPSKYVLGRRFQTISISSLNHLNQVQKDRPIGEK